MLSNEHCDIVCNHEIEVMYLKKRRGTSSLVSLAPVSLRILLLLVGSASRKQVVHFFVEVVHVPAYIWRHSQSWGYPEDNALALTKHPNERHSPTPRTYLSFSRSFLRRPAVFGRLPLLFFFSLFPPSLLLPVLVPAPP